MVFLCNITLSPKIRYICMYLLYVMFHWQINCFEWSRVTTYFCHVPTKGQFILATTSFVFFLPKIISTNEKKNIQEIKRERFLIKDIFRLPWLVKLSVFCTTLHLLQRKWFSLTLIRAIHILVRFRDQQTTVT